MTWLVLLFSFYASGLQAGQKVEPVVKYWVLQTGDITTLRVLVEKKDWEMTPLVYDLKKASIADVVIRQAQDRSTEVCFRGGGKSNKKALDTTRKVLDAIRHWLNNVTMEEIPAPKDAGRNAAREGFPAPRAFILPKNNF